MSEQPVNTEQPPSPGSSGQESISFLDKAAGVFYEPSKVFESLKTSPLKFADWFVPVLLVALLAGVNVYLRFASPDLRFQMAQMQERYIDNMVTQGKMTADQAQQAKDRMENGSTSVTVVSVIVAIVAVFIFFFIIAGIWFLVGKFALKGNITYTHALGILGLSEWIAVVGVIIGTVVMVAMSRLDGGLHLGLLTQMNTDSKAYLFMSKIDVFTIWSLVVIAIGLGRFAGRKGIMPAACVCAVWVIWVLVSIFALGGRFG
ncbi:MAG TPA: YIP1 family protein [Candidatus Kryptonia bacterium]